MIELQVDVLHDIVYSQPKVMVMFGTDWCGNCDILKPEYDRVSKENKNLPFIFVNPDIHKISSQMVDLTNIPMVVGFNNGEIVVSKFGNRSEIVQEVLDFLIDY